MGSLQYQSLDPTRPEIRVLAILPSFRKLSTIKCKLVKVDLDLLDEAPFAFYEALSYTWGDATSTESITLDGHTFQVTRNLAAVLRRLRGRTRKRYLWVDAICINQTDISERKNQVMKMKMIYERSIQALVWLGEEAEGSGAAMDLIDKMTDADTPDEWIRTSLERAEDLWQWQALGHIFARPYWRRVWIRQEVAVATEVYVLCGNRTQKWTTLVMACEILSQNLFEFDSIVAEISPYTSGYHQAIFIDTIRENIRDAGSAGFQNMLFHNRACESTDPRDRVYAVLGIVNNDEVKGLEPDYSMQKEEVFRAAVESLIHNTRSLDVLSACQDPERESGLPSWVPNFEVDWKAQILRVKEGGENLYHASADIPVEGDSIQRPNENALAINGIICDEVEDIGDLYKDDSTLNKVLETWRQIALKTLTLKRLALTEHEIFESYWRTLIADQDLAGDRASQDAINDITSHIVDADRPIPKLDLESGNTIFNQRFRVVAESRRLVGSKNGKIGLASVDVEVGDCICVFHGAGVPFVLRKKLNHYVIVGEACKLRLQLNLLRLGQGKLNSLFPLDIHGLMDGEAIRLVENEEAALEKIVLY
jgi:hypothetical protein